MNGSRAVITVEALSKSRTGVPVLANICLTVAEGSVTVVVGSSGSGKSTLSKVLAGHPAYTVTAGSVLYRGENLLELAPEQRARAGLFLGFQYPVEIPGVNNLEFLRVATNARRTEQGSDELDTFAFEDLVRERLGVVQMDPGP